ncbi:Crp/Fnr family transcriptional regulator [Silvibacterium acidisoli]|uniref:Crp/Fnr family transcriptional regulator n=1 Tax=Acidobacteriaceae bacterium ZG23-2 TaxID=2883246 RepID=UPI00406C6B17
MQANNCLEKETSSLQIPAFAPVISPLDNMQFVEELPPPLHVVKGTALLRQDEPVKTVYLIQDGLVKLSYLSDSGHEVTLGLRTEGWYAGAASALLNTPAPYTVETVVACSVSRIPVRNISYYLMQNPKATIHFISVLCQEHVSQSRAQLELMASSAEDRLERFMQERDAHQERWTTLDPWPLMKQMDIAKLLGITPEHLSRLIRKRHHGRESLRAIAK